MLCFIFVVYHLFITGLPQTGCVPYFHTWCGLSASYSNDWRPIYDCMCIVLSLAFVLSCVCKLVHVLKHYDDDDDGTVKYSTQQYEVVTCYSVKFKRVYYGRPV